MLQINLFLFVCAQAGYETIVREVDQEFIDKGFAAIDKNLSRAVDKGKMESDAKDKTMSLLKGTLDLNDLKGCDLIIEAIIEDLR